MMLVLCFKVVILIVFVFCCFGFPIVMMLVLCTCFLFRVVYMFSAFSVHLLGAGQDWKAAGLSFPAGASEVALPLSQRFSTFLHSF